MTCSAKVQDRSRLWRHAQIDLAIERGELQGNGALGWASIKARQQHWLDDKKIQVLAQYGLQRYQELARRARRCWSLRRTNPPAKP